MDQKPNKCILAIDDDRLQLKTIENLLQLKGYKVLCASSGEEGLQLAKLHKPNLILLDVLMPGMKGREVCRRLKADDATKSIPVIFVTAKESEDDITAEMAAGAVDHLTKPVRPEIFIRKIEGVLNMQA